MSWLLSVSAALALSASSSDAAPSSSAPPPETSAAPEAPPSLDALLDALGEDALRAEKAACTLTERTVVEDLDDKGAPKGKVVREFRVTQREDGPLRALREEQIEGDPSALFTRKPEEQGEKPKPGPFHPSQRSHYRYTLDAAPGAETATLRFVPRKPHADRPKGSAVVDLRGRKLVRLSVEPSKYPAFLDELRMQVTMRDTPCGRQPSHVVSEGEGGIMFMKARFRSDTQLSGHALAR